MSVNIFFLLVLSLLSLTALLPVGMWLGISSSLWEMLFCLHLFCWCGVVLWSCWRIVYEEQKIRKYRLFLLLLWAVFVFLESFHPVTARDALIHHLAVPQWWLSAGKIIEIPWHDWSYYPMLLQLAFTGFLHFEQPTWCVLYHASYLVFGLACLVCAASCLQIKDYAKSFLVLLTLSFPLLVRLSAIPLVDLGLFAFCALCVYGLVLLCTKEKLSYYPLVIIGVAMSASMACKYNGLLFTALSFPLALLGVLHKTKSSRSLLVAACLLVLTSTSFFAPWAIKNYLWTDNPLYPLAKKVFLTESQIPEGIKPRDTFFDRELGLYERSLGDIALLPLSMLFFGKDNDPKYFDGVLSPFLLLSLITLFAYGKKDSKVFLLLAQSFLYVIAALLLSGSRVRYLLPAIPGLLLLSALALSYLETKTPRLQKILMLMSLAQVFVAGIYIYGFLKESKPLLYLISLDIFVKESADMVYLKTRIPEYSAIYYINHHLAPSTDKVYILFTSNLFSLYKIPVFSGGFYSDLPLQSWLVQAKTAEDLREIFRKEKITHLLVNLSRFKNAFSLNLDSERAQIWNDFQTRSLEVVAGNNITVLWKLK